MGKRMKPILAWGGFSMNRLFTMDTTDEYEVPGKLLEIFTTRKAARCRYQDVRRVRITEVSNER